MAKAKSTLMVKSKLTEEYMMIFTKTKKLATKKKISKIFHQADADGSGTLSI